MNYYLIFFCKICNKSTDKVRFCGQIHCADYLAGISLQCSLEQYANVKLLCKNYTVNFVEILGNICSNWKMFLVQSRKFYVMYIFKKIVQKTHEQNWNYNIKITHLSKYLHSKLLFIIVFLSQKNLQPYTYDKTNTK